MEKKSFSYKFFPWGLWTCFLHCVKCKESRGESRHSKWRPSLKLNERHHCKIKSESLLLFPTLKWGSFVKKEGRSWKSHFWQAFMTSEYRTFLRGYERNIFRAARRGGTSLSLSPTPPPPQKKPDSQASHLRTLPKTTFSLQVQKTFSAFMLTFFFSKNRINNICSQIE